ncbi:MAG: 23S rRNA (uracil(1939)-C(5))-methyltransferase RlmD [Desulfobulbaceae bacterium]|nr:23S rRNA (uracil(1939)-C(5))-methyltransferase RlmD [Desulfobulbaceae bacterium]
MNHTIRIEKIIHGGQGLARQDDGFVILVPFVLPGEQVLAREQKKLRGHIEAEPVEILEPSPDRVVPPCPYYMQCGGCDLQHMSPGAQHAAKESIVRESLTRAGIDPGEHVFRPIVPSPGSFGYRHRIRLKIDAGGAIGFHRAGSNSIVDIENCLVATDLLNRALDELRRSGLAKAAAPAVKEIELLHSPADDRVYCVLHTSGDPAGSKKIIADCIPELETIAAVTIIGRTKAELKVHGRDESVLRQDFAGIVPDRPYSLSWTPGCFSQVNAGQNVRLVELACQMAGEVKGREALDLFCGMGNFSIPLALKGGLVTGIERHQECIERARINAARADLPGIRFIDRDVNKWMRKAVKRSAKYDMVLLDPPRKGMGRDIIQVAELSPSRIIYISCDPATLARDIALLQNCGYSLASIAPVDMFPQTHHIETVVMLEKN